MQRIPLTGAVPDPPVGTTPAPTHFSVTGVTAFWAVPGRSVQFAVATGDAGIAQVTVTTTIASITLDALTKAVLPLDPKSAQGFEALALSDGQVTAVAPAGTLVYRATIADGWSPFGLKQAHLEKVAFALASINDPTYGIVQQVELTANLILGHTTLPIEIDVPLGAGSWNVGIVPPGVTIKALGDIAALLGDEYGSACRQSSSA